MTAKALTLLLALYWHQPQLDVIHHYAWVATGTDRNPAHWRTSTLDPCAKSMLGEGLVDVTGVLRHHLHADTGFEGCVPAAVQIAWLSVMFPKVYPECARKFERGELSAFQRCWGNGLPE